MDPETSSQYWHNLTCSIDLPSGLFVVVDELIDDRADSDKPHWDSTVKQRSTRSNGKVLVIGFRISASN